MQKGIMNTISNLRKKVVFGAMFLLVTLVNVLIFVGEITQKIIIYPFLYSYKAIKFLISSSITAFKTSSKEHLAHESKQSYTPIKLSLFKETKETKTVWEVLKPSISFVKKGSHSFLQKTIRFLFLLGNYSVKALWTFLKMIFYAIIRLPLYLFYFVNEVAYFIYSCIKGFIRFCVKVYRYLTGPLFRSFLYGFAFCLLVVIAYHGYLFVSDLPSPRSIGKMNFAQSTHLYDRNGKLLYEIYRDVNRTPIKVSELPPYVAEATIAIEDKNFYKHKGISFFGGILRAARDTIRYKDLQGGSTITQQLVKSALLSPERTLERKAKEIVLAIWTEQIYSKDQILEMYLNQVPYGGASYGIEEAAKVYYGKEAKYLTLDEAALLAGLPQAPSLYSPYINPEAATYRRNDVLKSMYKEGYISKNQLDTALHSAVNIKPPVTSINAPHFVFYTRSKMEEEYGNKVVEEGGFKVTTSLDLDIQNKAEQILNEELDKIKDLNVTNGGIIVLQPQTGEILAMVGSKNYFDETNGAFNVTTALRQPGSTLKPMLYAMALERGYTAASIIDDSPIIFQNPGGIPYAPVNYDGRFHGRVTVRTALSNSYNIPAVKTLNMMGVQPFVDYAKIMGIDTWQDSSRFGLSLSLGGGEVTLLDLAQVYNVFATTGYRVEPTPFKKIVDDKEHVIYDESDIAKTKVLDAGIAYIISDILSDNIARQEAFGPHSALEIPGYKVSVKTGTTNDKKDNLTVGYTPEFLVAVWVGNNDNTPMNPTLTSGITGAAPIWNRVMTYLLTEKSTGEQFKMPSDVISKPCYGGGRNEYFLIGTESKANCYDTKIGPSVNAEKKQEARNTTVN